MFVWHLGIQHIITVSLQRDLKCYQGFTLGCRLEKDKEAAAVAATTQRSVGGSRQQSRPGSASAYQGASLADSLKPHKSRLEREKEAAAASAVSVQQHAGVKVKAAAATWEGMGGLSDLKIHKSKLQRDREAWLAAVSACFMPLHA